MKRRVAASAGITALVAGVLSGCMFITPQQTARSYTPSDGVNGQVGAVQIRNVLLLTGAGTAAAGSANMLGVLVNSADTAQTVTLQYATASGTDSTTVTVPANGLLSLRPDTSSQSGASVPTQAKAVRLDGVDASPGSLFSVGFGVGSTAPVSLQLPVLTGTLSEYASLLPTPTPTPTPTPAPTGSATPGASGSATPGTTGSTTPAQGVSGSASPAPTG